MNVPVKYCLVDYAKFFFAVCVLCMHTEICVSADAGGWVDPLLFQSAVPYFFVASGFFFGRKLYETFFSKDTIKSATLRIIKRLGILLIIYEPVSIVLCFIKAVLSGSDLGLFWMRTIRSVFFYPLGALWYIQATLIAVLLLLPLLYYRKEKFIVPLGLLFLCFGLITTNYFFIVKDSSLALYLQKFLVIIKSTRNGLFFGFFYVGVGILIAKCLPYLLRYKKYFLPLFILSTISIVWEVYQIRYLAHLNQALYISQIFYIPLLFLLTLSYSDNVGIFGSNSSLYRCLSTSIYLLHRPIIYLFEILYLLFIGQSYVNETPYILFLFCVFVLTVILVFAYNKKGVIYKYII